MPTHNPQPLLYTMAAALFLLLLPAPSLRAQSSASDSIGLERMIAAERPDLSFAGSARMVLLRRLRGNQYPESRAVLRFMDRRRTAESSTWLSATERLIAETLIADSLLIRNASRMENLLANARVTERQHPLYDDNLHELLRTLLRERIESVTGRFMLWEPTLGERWFINLLINHLHVRGLRGQEDLNSRVDEFERKVPDSPLLPVAQRYIWKKYSEADFGAGFSAGYSLGTFDGSLGRYFSSYHGPSLAGELYLYRITVAGHLNFGVAEAVREFTAAGEQWHEGDSPFINGSLAAGYEFRFGRLAITPLVGLGMQSVRGADPSEVETSDLPRTHDRIGLEIGAILGYRIPSDKGTHIDLRLRGGRTSSGLSNYDPLFDGSLWYLQFAFALVQRPYEGR